MLNFCHCLAPTVVLRGLLWASAFLFRALCSRLSPGVSASPNVRVASNRYCSQWHFPPSPLGSPLWLNGLWGWLIVSAQIHVLSAIWAGMSLKWVSSLFSRQGLLHPGAPWVYQRCEGVVMLSSLLIPLLLLLPSVWRSFEALTMGVWQKPSDLVLALYLLLSRGLAPP